MKTKIYLLFLGILLINTPFLSAQEIKEYDNPAIISFETMPNTTFHDEHSSLSLSNKHFKHLDKSLQWSWNTPNAHWGIKQEIGYSAESAKDEAFLPTFVFWVYAEKPIKDKVLKVQFLKDGKVHCWFDYKLGFTGWRGAWVGFGRDMQGTPVDGMDEVRFSVPDVPKGTLFFDHIILSSIQDIRQHTADFQAPYINPNTKSHWLILLKSWNKKFDIPLKKEISNEEKESILEVEQRVEDLLLRGKKATPFNQLKDAFLKYNIATDAEGNITGEPIFFERYGETYEYLGAPDYSEFYPKNNPRGLKFATQTLLNLANSYHLTTDAAKKEIADMFVLLTRQMLDQGFQAGSAMGTLHHLGYSIRNFYPAMFLMRDVLKEHGLRDKVQQSMEWFAGTGEIKTDNKGGEMDIDAFNTSLIGRLTSVLTIDDIAQKTRYLYTFSRWVDEGFKYSDGTKEAFKVDGSIYHHRHNYPAYAIGGLSGAIQAVYLLKGTMFKISQESHQILKDALLSMRIYCNLRTWPLSLSGRHPDGKGHLIPEHFGLLASAGSPDGKQKIDKELATAYLRLIPKETSLAKEFKTMGIQAESSPTGNWSFPYSCLNVHRRDDWMVAAMGHSRYLWATEIYRNQNMYGRYLNHGALQIIATGNPISINGSGFRQEGWDWNHFPGTTATVLPMKELRADVKNLDAVSGFEEMLLSDEAFAGGISLLQKQGAFGMKLHEHDKYNGSLRARKSFFFFDNRIVALGTNIESALANPTQTTLFQVYLERQDKPFYLNGKTITEFPYQETVKDNKTVLSDGLNNYFFVKGGAVEFKKSNQHSFHEETEEPTQNDFAVAAINHGGNLKNGRYEYMILVQPDKSELNISLKTEDLPYIIFQQDSMAHIVRDIATKTTGYVLFESGRILSEKLLVKATDTPCLVMTDESNSDKIIMSVADPDLRFYEGDADEIYDENGKRIERSVYSREWKNNPSLPSTIQITLRGNWKLSQDVEGVSVQEHQAQNTVLIVTSKDGKGPEFEIEKL